ncbi:MAG: hypothetical protein NT154_30610 [Verrucomicrobia bacterium]|nr:hypothetical protein [Verrucomicrobiota bacterium]
MDSARTEVFLQLGYEAARTDAGTAIRLAWELPSGDEQSRLLAHAVGEWATIDPGAAKDWASQLPDFAARSSALAAVALATAESSPQAAATLVVEELPPGTPQQRSAIAVVQRWAQTAPEQAASWVEQFPSNEFQNVTAQCLSAVWAERSPDGPLRWAQGIADGALRQAVLQTMVESQGVNSRYAN